MYLNGRFNVGKGLQVYNVELWLLVGLKSDGRIKVILRATAAIELGAAS